MTQDEIIEKHKSVERRQSDHRLFGGYDFEYLNKHGAAKAMDEWADRVALDFAKWLEENTTTIREPKITLYRYRDRENKWGNYRLEDIFLEFKERYEP